MTDYTVEISGFPEIKNHEELDVLAARLSLHISRIVKEEDEIFAG